MLGYIRVIAVEGDISRRVREHFYEMKSIGPDYLLCMDSEEEKE